MSSGEDTPSPKTRKRRLSQTDAHYIDHVRKVLKTEKETQISLHTSDVNRRTAHLLGVSRRSVANVATQGVLSFPADTTPEVRQRAPFVDQEHILAIKEKYISFVAEKKKRPTYRELFAVLTAAREWPFTMTTLFKGQGTTMT